ncbi:hypothetical protein JTE90_007028 [Oedothorax gibbosus]|uniref:Uncharacterized protein n=1 Tax=Oedothorax gibbosus TaxID=931172 RepID=A0AAV6U5M4_9ARAC|nr:hypothetical protein JTE90_007028 [Oedothorax gibbosus]
MLRVSFPWIPASVDLKAPVTKSPLSIHRAAKETNRLVISLGLEFLEFLLSLSLQEEGGGGLYGPEIYIYTKTLPLPRFHGYFSHSSRYLCHMLHPWLLNFLLSDVLIFRFQIFLLFFTELLLEERKKRGSLCVLSFPPPSISIPVPTCSDFYLQTGNLCFNENRTGHTEIHKQIIDLSFLW